jgi:hypothetical protein
VVLVALLPVVIAMVQLAELLVLAPVATSSFALDALIASNSAVRAVVAAASETLASETRVSCSAFIVFISL